MRFLLLLDVSRAFVIKYAKGKRVEDSFVVYLSVTCETSKLWVLVLRVLLAPFSSGIPSCQISNMCATRDLPANMKYPRSVYHLTRNWLFLGS